MMIHIDTFRGDEFVDREREIEYLKKRFSHTPKEILWLYGPKSTGKTTLIEYVIEKELTSGLKLFDRYWIKYINFRRAMVSNYDSFIDSFFEEAEGEDDFTSDIKGEINLGVIRLESKLLQKIKERKKNLFIELIEKLKKINKQKLIIIDEIQTLEEIYYNGEKELLKEFLNFCVALTKELHLAHVVILSSNTIFIERIYNDAKLKVTSRLKKIDHLDKETTFAYLAYKDPKIDKELVWDYLGGCIPLIQRLFYEKDEFDTIRSYLEDQVRWTESEVIDFMIRFVEKRDMFEDILRAIVERGCYRVQKDEKKEMLQMIELAASKEIFFYDPLSREVRGNNRLYEKAFERFIPKIESTS